MDMQTIMAAAAAASGQAQGNAASAGNAGASANGNKFAFIAELNKVLGGSAYAADGLSGNAALAAGVIPLSVLMAIAPQAGDAETEELVQQLIDALGSDDSELLDALMSHPALGSWLTQWQTALEANVAVGGQAMHTLDHDALQLILAIGMTASTGEQPDAKQQQLALEQLLNIFKQAQQASAAGTVTEQQGAGFRAMMNELSASFPQLSAATAGLAEGLRQAVKTDSFFSGSTQQLTSLIHTVSSGSTEQVAIDQGRSPHQFLERLSFMQPIAQVVASQSASVEADAAQPGTSKLAAAAETAGDHAVPMQAAMGALKSNAAAEAKAPAPVMRSEQFATEMSRFVVKNMTITQSNGISQARITLMPEHLGQLDVKIQMQNGQITASFLAETAAARDMLENQLPILRAALQQQGLQVERIVVSNQQAFGSGLFQEGREQSAKQQSESGSRSGKSADADIDFALEIGDKLELDPTHPEYGNTFSATA